MTVNDFYNDKFDESTRLSGNDNRHKVELLRKRFLYKYIIDRLKPKKIVQIACGTGVHTEWLCENYPNIDIYASDIIPKHIEQLKDYPNLHKQVWNCLDELPWEYEQSDLVLVEGAWYHLAKSDRLTLLKHTPYLNPSCIIIDWLSAWHDTTQRLLQDEIVPKDFTNPRPDEPFVFDTEDDLYNLTKYFNDIRLFPVDMDLRFGYTDLNSVDDNTFNNYIQLMNDNIKFYSAENLYLMNTTEHGCYIIYRRRNSHGENRLR